jgi:succinate dehydrogenase / fumarate reductase, iron-sulfur subunit
MAGNSTEKRTYHLNVWRQNGPNAGGAFKKYTVKDITPDASFLEMMDILNEDLQKAGEEPVAFDHDCREGICGSCGMVINGRPHGPQSLTTTCQLHMRTFKDNETIYIEPFRATAFPIVKDLFIDRRALDRIQQAGGYVSVDTGSSPDANAIPIGKSVADAAFSAATCIGCGACVAACKNASATLFLSAKVSHLALLPQGQPERQQRVLSMVGTMQAEGFGHCTNTGACEAECPVGINLSHISMLNREYIGASLSVKQYDK